MAVNGKPISALNEKVNLALDDFTEILDASEANLSNKNKKVSEQTRLKLFKEQLQKQKEILSGEFDTKDALRGFASPTDKQKYYVKEEDAFFEYDASDTASTDDGFIVLKTTVSEKEYRYIRQLSLNQIYTFATVQEAVSKLKKAPDGLKAKTIDFSNTVEGGGWYYQVKDSAHSPDGTRIITIVGDKHLEAVNYLVDTAANLSTNNPYIFPGASVFESDTGKGKTNKTDAAQRFNDLLYSINFINESGTAWILGLENKSLDFNNDSDPDKASKGTLTAYIKRDRFDFKTEHNAQFARLWVNKPTNIVNPTVLLSANDGIHGLSSLIIYGDRGTRIAKDSAFEMLFYRDGIEFWDKRDVKEGAGYRGFGETSKTNPAGVNFDDLAWYAWVPRKFVEDLAKGLTVPVTDAASITVNCQKHNRIMAEYSTTKTAQTITFQNVSAKSNIDIRITKTNAADLVLTLAGAGLTHFGYDDLSLNSTPEILLSGPAGSAFRINGQVNTTGNKIDWSVGNLLN
ncbi:hypothetical protein AAG747_15480 [Rapidithrix thailandica]|uniref:Uncharacterized protein n=1 Tax=Rapidithrix thailandica TaxID=413964 RepID=A0AAW9S295_9BACT